MNSVQIISFNHRQFNFDEIGIFHLEDENKFLHLREIKSILEADELMYLSTCNRVEFIVHKKDEISNEKLTSLINYFLKFNPSKNKIKLHDKLELFIGQKAVHHLFSVASSLDSLVLGEREIITQVRKSFEECKLNGLCGDVIRVLIQMTIQTAKKVYTESKIATRPVSLVSLAFLELQKSIDTSPKNIIVIGAGKTVTSLLRFISKNKTHHYTIYNRSIAKAESLNNLLKLNANVFPISSLGDHEIDFDFIISATSSKEPILNNNIYTSFNSKSKKSVIVDLAVPKDCNDEMSQNNNIKMISVDQLKKRADENLKIRSKEIKSCLKIIDEQINLYISSEKERDLERAMSAVPARIKGIRKKAYAEVFAKELQNLDPNAREVLDSFLDYMEKKYISVPMKMAKDILLKESIK
ncbi:MAG: glutamyl-tRNA reductase [Parvicellaceae bacterium]